MIWALHMDIIEYLAIKCSSTLVQESFFIMRSTVNAMLTNHNIMYKSFF